MLALYTLSSPFIAQFVPAKLQIQEPNTLVVAMGAPEAAVAGAAAMTLERFADLSDRNKAILLGLGALAPAAALLANEDPDVRAQAACFFYTMTNSYDVRQAIRKQGLVVTAPMLAMLTPESGPVQNENASGFFANMFVLLSLFILLLHPRMGLILCRCLRMPMLPFPTFVFFMYKGATNIRLESSLGSQESKLWLRCSTCRRPTLMTRRQ